MPDTYKYEHKVASSIILEEFETTCNNLLNDGFSWCGNFNTTYTPDGLHYSMLFTKTTVIPDEIVPPRAGQ